MKPIYFIGGGKGGVGKSMVTCGLLDLLIEHKRQVLLIDTDTSNPDVYKIYSKEIDSLHLNLDVVEGWIDMINACADRKDAVVVVNSAARNMEGIGKFAQALTSSLDELERKLVTFWVINRQRDSVELLKSFTKMVPESTIHVIRNGYFGSEDKYQLYNTSKLRQEIEEKGGLSVLFPDLADRVCDEIYSNRMPIAAAVQKMPIGNRAELLRWRRTMHTVLGELLDAA